MSQNVPSSRSFENEKSDPLEGCDSVLSKKVSIDGNVATTTNIDKGVYIEEVLEKTAAHDCSNHYTSENMVTKTRINGGENHEDILTVSYDYVDSILDEDVGKEEDIGTITSVDKGDENKEALRKTADDNCFDSTVSENCGTDGEGNDKEILAKMANDNYTASTLNKKVSINAKIVTIENMEGENISEERLQNIDMVDNQSGTNEVPVNDNEHCTCNSKTDHCTVNVPPDSIFERHNSLRKTTSLPHYKVNEIQQSLPQSKKEYITQKNETSEMNHFSKNSSQQTQVKPQVPMEKKKHGLGNFNPVSTLKIARMSPHDSMAQYLQNLLFLKGLEADFFRVLATGMIIEQLEEGDMPIKK
eukprot:Awhi_evm1s14188